MANLGAVVLDPGHGGPSVPPKKDGSSWNNATSVSGVLEKNLALDFCKILKAELEEQAAEAGDTVTVFLTRTTDVNVGIADRAGMAGANDAKLFISLHFNGFDDPTVRGAETFYADRLNGNANEDEDRKFAGAMHAALLAGLRSADPATRDRRLKSDRLSEPKKLGTLNDVALGNTGRDRKCLAAYFEVEFITNPAVDAVLISGPGAMANRIRAMAPVAGAMLTQLRAMP